MLRAQTHRLIRAVSPGDWALVAALVWFGLNLLCLERFPTVFIDEAENGNHAYNLAYHGQAVFSLYDDLYPRHLGFLRQSWPPVIRPVFVRSLAAVIKLIGFSLFRARLFSLTLGMLCLLLVYWAGAKLGKTSLRKSAGPAYGLTAMGVMGIYFPFLYGSHTIRPEMYLALNGLCVFAALLLALQTERPGWFIAAGVLTGLAPGIHTNGVALVVPVSIALLGNDRRRGTFWACAGWVVGTLIFVRLADWDRFIPGYYALFFREFTIPPLLSSRGNLAAIFINETGRYFGNWIFNQWTGGLLFNRLLSVEHVVIAAVVIRGCLQKNSERFTALFTASLAMTYAFLVGQKASNYLAALAPFFALTTAVWVVDSWDEVRLGGTPRMENAQILRTGLTLSGWTILAIAPVGTVLMVLSIACYRPSFIRIAAQFSAQIPSGSRIAGPQSLWLGIPSDSYRDIGVLVWHRLLLNEKNLWKPLEEWKPDYLILESSMSRRFEKLARLPRQPPMRGPTGFLPWAHEVVDVLATGPAYGDSMALIHIDWPKGNPK